MYLFFQRIGTKLERLSVCIECIQISQHLLSVCICTTWILVCFQLIHISFLLNKFIIERCQYIRQGFFHGIRTNTEIGIRQHFSHRINVIFQTDSETVLYIRQYFIQGTGKFRLVCLRLGFGRKRCGKKHSKKDSFHLFLIYVSCFFTTDTTDFHRFIILII